MASTSRRSSSGGGAVFVAMAAIRLEVGFYDESCPAAERIVRDREYVRQHVRCVLTVAAALLRLHYHDNGNTTTDPLPLAAAYAVNLRERKCRTAGDGVVEMDPGSHLTFDLGYYRGVLKHRALLRSDAAVRADIAGVVPSSPEVFFQVFGRSMAWLRMVQVKTGSEGEIRRNCAVVNS